MSNVFLLSDTVTLRCSRAYYQATKLFSYQYLLKMHLTHEFLYARNINKGNKNDLTAAFVGSENVQWVKSLR